MLLNRVILKIKRLQRSNLQLDYLIEITLAILDSIQEEAATSWR